MLLVIPNSSRMTGLFCAFWDVAWFSIQPTPHSAGSVVSPQLSYSIRVVDRSHAKVTRCLLPGTAGCRQLSIVSCILRQRKSGIDLRERFQSR